MTKNTNAILKKIETVFKQLHYTIRYEKGTFQSGYCLVKDKQVLVMNKFYTTEARIQCFIEILNEIQVDETLLDEEHKEFYNQIKPIDTAPKN